MQQKLQNGIVRANLGVEYHDENKIERKRAIKRKNYNYACSKKTNGDSEAEFLNHRGDTPEYTFTFFRSEIQEIKLDLT